MLLQRPESIVATQFSTLMVPFSSSQDRLLVRAWARVRCLMVEPNFIPAQTQCLIPQAVVLIGVLALFERE
jgi:hypothetical protein